MSEEDNRAFYESLHSRVLDDLRKAVRYERLSILIRIVAQPERLEATFRGESPRDWTADDEELYDNKLRAALLACCDEIDRRLPPPPTPEEQRAAAKRYAEAVWRALRGEPERDEPHPEHGPTEGPYR